MYEIGTDSPTTLRLSHFDWHPGGALDLTIAVGQTVNEIFTSFTTRVASFAAPDVSTIMNADTTPGPRRNDLELVWLQFLIDRGDFNDLGALSIYQLP